jgi:serine/threonine-protein kinase
MLVGQSIGPFLIEKELGSGAMGTVFRVLYEGEEAKLLRELGPSRRMALKVIAFGLTGNETAVARFLREAEILKQLKHPNIVRLYATGRYRDTPFFAMEYIDGQSLDRVLTRRDRFSWDEVVRFGQQLCSALQHAHQKGIIHRDLKPSNLMMTKEGTLKLTDFGIAKDIDLTALTGANNTIGTAAYMSPEQCKGERNLTPKSDLYSLGVVFYELVTGKKPFVAESAVDMFLMHVQGEFVRPGRIVPEIPVWLDTLICQLMEKKPEHRPRDAAMVAEALEEVADKVTAQKSAGEEIAHARFVDQVRFNAPPDQIDREASRAIKAGAKRKRLRKKHVPFYRRGWFTLLAAIAFLGLIGGAIYLATRPDDPQALYTAIERAKSPEGRQRAIDHYLSAYGDKDTELTQKVRALDRDEKAANWDKVLLRRYNKDLRTPEAEYDKIAYQLVITGLDAEADGDLDGAAERWKELADKYQNDPDPKRALWGWVGAKKLRDLQEVKARVAQLDKKIEDNEIEEAEQKFADLTEVRAADAQRLERLGDLFTARERWAKLKEDLIKVLDDRPWFLVAAWRLREISVHKEKLKPEDREPLLRQKLDEVPKLLAHDNSAVRRDGRNLLRAIRDLYRNEVAGLKKYADEAERMLAGAMK